VQRADAVAGTHRGIRCCRCRERVVAIDGDECMEHRLVALDAREQIFDERGGGEASLRDRCAQLVHGHRVRGVDPIHLDFLHGGSRVMDTASKCVQESAMFSRSSS
jgi:hypothetical protein